jgi:hypothetical protein
MKSAYEGPSETQAWKDSLQKIDDANAEAQRAGKKRRDAHEKQVAKMHASADTKGTPGEVYR